MREREQARDRVRAGRGDSMKRKKAGVVTYCMNGPRNKNMTGRFKVNKKFACISRPGALDSNKPCISISSPTPDAVAFWPLSLRCTFAFCRCLSPSLLVAYFHQQSSHLPLTITFFAPRRSRNYFQPTIISLFLATFQTLFFSRRVAFSPFSLSISPSLS